MNTTTYRVMQFVSVTAIFFLLLSTTALAQKSCPASNPADFDKPEDIDEKKKRRWLLCKCGEQQPDGYYALVDSEKAKNFLILLNDNFLARYDEDCSGDLECEGEKCDEKGEFIKDQRAVLNERFAGLKDRFKEAKKEAKIRASHRIKKWRKIIEGPEGKVEHEVALGVFSDPPAKEKKISLSYFLMADSAQEVENAKFGFRFREKLRASRKGNYKFSTAIAVDLSWKEVDTDAASTVTRAADFLPLGVSIAPIKPLTFRASAGIGYLKTEKLDIVKGVKESKNDVAHVYKIGVSYQTSMPCLALGVDYKIRTDKAFSQRLSYEWLPTITFDFTKECSTNK